MFYIGVTKRELRVRLNHHLWSSETKRRATGQWRYQHHTAWKLRKMRKQKREVGIEALLSFSSPLDVWEAERKYISWGRNVGFQLTNGTTGGEGTYGRRLTESQREHLRRINSGTGNPQYGKSPSAETREKQRSALTGRPNPGLRDPNKKEKWRKKISDNHADVSGSNNPMYGKKGELAPTAKRVEQIDANGVIVGVFGSTREASRKTGVSSSSISMCARGKAGHAGGFRWRY